MPKKHWILEAYFALADRSPLGMENMSEPEGRDFLKWAFPDYADKVDGIIDAFAAWALRDMPKRDETGN